VITSNAIPAAAPSNREPAIHLLIAEDSQMGCELLADAFRRPRSPFHVVACAVSRQEIIRSLKSRTCDVALISDTLTDGPLTGFQALGELRHSFPKTRSVMLLKPNHQDLVIDAFRVGAKGVYCRTEPLESLTKCIMAVHGGQIWANSAQLNLVFSAFAEAAPLRLAEPKRRTPLTRREQEVLNLVIEGLTNRQVGQQLGLAEQTVANNLFRIYEKLGISSRVELVLYARSSRQG
jgi:two-component system, NarL family, nitrate/nitrite response regulator NarL